MVAGWRVARLRRCAVLPVDLGGQRRRAARFGRWDTVLLSLLLVLLGELGLALLWTLLLAVWAGTGAPAHQPAWVGRRVDHLLNGPLGIVSSFWLAQLAMLGALYLRVVRPRHLGWADLGLGRALGRAPTTAVLLGLGLGLLGLAFMAAVSLVLQALGVTTNAQAAHLGPMRGSTPPVALLFLITTGLSAPLVEELFFRGYLVRALCGHYSRWLSLVVSAALFAFVHLLGGVGWDALPLFAFGLLLGWGYVRTGNLLCSVSAHALNNLIVVFFLFHG